MAQGAVDLRIALTSLELLDTQAGSTLELKEGDDRVLEIGARQQVRARFKLPSGGGAAILKQIPKGENRIGLFLNREREAIASVQRGTLEKCETSFCSAVFQGNGSFQFYIDELKNPSNWFVQILQNPILEERLLEVENSDSGWFNVDWIQATLSYGRKAVKLSETSSTPFNDSKISRKTSFGNEWTLFSNFDRWEFYGRLYSVTLDTQGFFSDDFKTNVSEKQYTLSYGYPVSDWILFGLTFGKIGSTFDTTNDDASILSSTYSAFLYGAYGRYILPFDIYGFQDGSFVLDAGQGMLGYYRSLKGRAKDTGEWKRGKSSVWNLTRIRYQHALKTRAASVWLDKLLLGGEVEVDFMSDKFTGAAEGPSLGLPAGTEATGSQLFWKIFIGREFVLR